MVIQEQAKYDGLFLYMNGVQPSQCFDYRANIQTEIYQHKVRQVGCMNIDEEVYLLSCCVRMKMGSLRTPSPIRVKDNTWML